MKKRNKKGNVRTDGEGDELRSGALSILEGTDGQDTNHRHEGGCFKPHTLLSTPKDMVTQMVVIYMTNGNSSR